MQASLFNIYSIGYAAENKALGSKELQVFPVEVLPYVDGEILYEPIEVEENGVDYFGEKYSVKVKTSLSINCHWLQWGGNRQTPPDIRRGEKVIMYRYADTDKYYWLSMGLDEHLRRLETVVYAWSNIREGNIEALTPENSYYVEVSTHNKSVTLATNKSDGEPYAFTVQINTKEGGVVITDDADNFIQLESSERKWHIHNRDNSEFILDKGKGYFNTPDSIEMNTRNYRVNCETYFVNAKNAITHKSPTFTGEITQSTFTGTVRVNNILFLAGGFQTVPGSGSASASITIPMTVTGNTDFNTTVKIDGVTVNNHDHTNPEGGNVGPMQ